jgi:hypothetical protein
MKDYINNIINNVPEQYKIDNHEVNRLTSHIEGDIFNSDECVLWNGYVTQSKSNSVHVNYIIRGKKTSLSRLLYMNYVGKLEPNNYIKYNCSNPGICCNLKHMYRVGNDNKKNTNVINSKIHLKFDD